MTDETKQRITWAAIIIIGLLVFLASGCPFKKKSGDAKEFIGAAPSRTAATTPLGVTVKKASGGVDGGILASIDAGLSKALRISQEPPNNYRQSAPHGAYTVGLWPRSNLCTNPAFVVRADGQPHYSTGRGWDQHPTYDKDPAPGKVLLCIAGITFYGNFNSQTPDQGTFGMLVVDDPSIMETIVWFEAEHEILKQVDINRWINTSGVHAHPIMGEGGAGLRATATTGRGEWLPWSFDIDAETAKAARDAGLRGVNEGRHACMVLTR